MSYSGSDMVLEERDFSVPSPVPVSAGVCVPPSVTYTCTSGASVVPESRVSQAGQSSAVSKTVSFRSGDLKDILVFKDSGMDSVSVESYQTGASDRFWEQDFSNLIEVNVPDMLYNHGFPSPSSISADRIQGPSCIQESVMTTSSDHTYVGDTFSTSMGQLYHPITTDNLSVHIPKLAVARARSSEGLSSTVIKSSGHNSQYISGPWDMADPGSFVSHVSSVNLGRGDDMYTPFDRSVHIPDTYVCTRGSVSAAAEPFHDYNVRVLDLPVTQGPSQANTGMLQGNRTFVSSAWVTPCTTGASHYSEVYMPGRVGGSTYMPDQLRGMVPRFTNTCSYNAAGAGMRHSIPYLSGEVIQEPISSVAPQTITSGQTVNAPFLQTYQMGTSSSHPNHRREYTSAQRQMTQPNHFGNALTARQGGPVNVSKEPGMRNFNVISRPVDARSMTYPVREVINQTNNAPFPSSVPQMGKTGAYVTNENINVASYPVGPEHLLNRVNVTSGTDLSSIMSRVTLASGEPGPQYLQMHSSSQAVASGYPSCPIYNSQDTVVPGNPASQLRHVYGSVVSSQPNYQDAIYLDCNQRDTTPSNPQYSVNNIQGSVRFNAPDYPGCNSHRATLPNSQLRYIQGTDVPSDPNYYVNRTQLTVAPSLPSYQVSTTMSIPVSSTTRAAHLGNFPIVTSQPLGLGSLINPVSQTQGNVVMSGSINPEPRMSELYGNVSVGTTTVGEARNVVSQPGCPGSLIQSLPEIRPVAANENTNVTSQPVTLPPTGGASVTDSSTKNKMLEPETFDGTSSAEWAEYIIHFEQIAEWNKWSNIQKAKMLSIKLRGEAQKLLGSLSPDQYNDYEILKTTLSHRFNPQERESAYRCEFRNRRRKKDESPSDFGFALRRLSIKAFPSLPYSALETHVVDQFIAGLGSTELQKFVQFQHPKTLEAAINLAIEYTAFVGNLDKIVKPALDKEGEVTSIVNELELQTKTTSLRPLEYTQNFSRKDLEQTVEEVITKKWKKIENQIGQILEAMKIQQNMDSNPRNTSNRESVNLSPRGRSPSRFANDKSPSRTQGNRSASRNRDNASSSFRRSNSSPNRQNINEQKSAEPRVITCTYCKRSGHVENRCWSKIRDLERGNLN